MAKVEANKGAISQFTNALPISAEQKAKLQNAVADPSSLVPSQVNAILEKAEGLKEQALAAQQSVLQVLPPSVAEAVLAKEAAIHQLVQEQVNQKLAAVASVASFVPLPVETITASVAAATATMTPVEVPPVADLVQVVISSENVEAVKAFLAEKVAEKEA
jgi:histone deacetylase complex regulatory component SIN3